MNLLVFVPGVDGQIIDTQFGNGIYKPFRKFQIGDQRDVEIDRFSTYQIIIGELNFLNAFWNVDDQIEVFVFNVRKGVGFTFFQRPVEND